jgi:hypothetical protein
MKNNFAVGATLLWPAENFFLHFLFLTTKRDIVGNVIGAMLTFTRHCKSGIHIDTPNLILRVNFSISSGRFGVNPWGKAKKMCGMNSAL